MKKTLKAIFMALALTLLFIIVQASGGVILGIYFGIHAAMNQLAVTPESATAFILNNVNLLVIINYAILLVAIWLLFIIRSMRLRNYISWGKISIKELPWIFCGALACQLLGLWLSGVVNQFYTLDNSYSEMFDSIQKGSLTMTLIAMVFVAPFVEEVFFRGLILKKLANHLHATAAILIQAVLFAAIHFNMAQLMPTFILGCFAAYLYLKTQNITVPIVFHMFFNAVAVFSAYAPESVQIIIGYGTYLATTLLALKYLPKLYNHQNTVLEHSVNEPVE